MEGRRRHRVESEAASRSHGAMGARGLGEGCQGSVWSSGVQTRAVGGEKRRYKSHILSSKAWRKKSLKTGGGKGGKRARSMI